MIHINPEDMAFQRVLVPPPVWDPRRKLEMLVSSHLNTGEEFQNTLSSIMRLEILVNTFVIGTL
jgi:hypothetical protein